jgi:hypothetical protein
MQLWRRGLPCSTWVQDNVVQSAAESGNCAEDTVLSTYATDDYLQTAIDTLRALDALMTEQKLKPDPRLIGPNWIINGPTAGRFADRSGGTVKLPADHRSRPLLQISSSLYFSCF